MKIIELKLIALARRVKEKFYSLPKGWEDLNPLARWMDVRYLDSNTFSQVLMQMPYMPKAIEGQARCTFQPKDADYFFRDMKGRMSEEWARAWVAYWLFHEVPVEEWLVSDVNDTEVKTVAIAKDRLGYALCDYEFQGYYPTVRDALSDVMTRTGGTIVATRYRRWR